MNHPSAPSAGPSGGPEPHTVLVADFAVPTGPVLHGATGSLYGVAEDGVPGDELLDALDLTTLAAGPDGGAQHPGGDASSAVAVLRRNGRARGTAGLAFVYLQDLFSSWPYEDVGIDVYHERLCAVVPPMLTEANAGRLVLVPFNEPDWIWYALKENAPSRFDRFMADWTTTVRLLRGLAPGVPIAGPNEAFFHREFLGHFLRRARDTGTLPEWIAWHELSPKSLADFRGHHAEYRELERALGIEPRPVNIDEYANNRDLSVPGQLVQWAALFEDAKVHADMAFWTAAGGYSGAAPQTNIPSGAWWLLKAYSGMTGETVRVTPPRPDTPDTLQGIASLDRERRTAQVLAGGCSGDFTITLDGLDPELWGEAVTATVHRIDWTGYEGAAGPPVPLSRVTGPPGRIDLHVPQADRMAAYWIAIAPGEAEPLEPPPWRGSWEAEHARITSGEVARQGHPGEGNGFAASGEYDVSGLNMNDSAVHFTVEVPAAGEYDLAVFYAHMYGRGAEATEPQPAQQVLAVNGAERFVEYPSTMNWQHRSVVHVPVRLRAGANTLELSKSGAIGTARGEVALDKIVLTEHRPERGVYDGAFARHDSAYDASASDDSASKDSTSYGASDDSAADGSASKGTAADDSTDAGGAEGPVFDVYASQDRYHRITGASRGVLLGPQNQCVPVDLTRPVFLHTGINRLRAAAARLVVEPAEGPAFIEVDAAEAVRTGGSCLIVNEFATGGHVIGWNGRGADAAISFEAGAGPHALIVSYANGERVEGHAYNVDIVTRHCDVVVNGKPTGRYPMRGTWTWNDFWTYPIIVDLIEGRNTITFGNEDGPTAEFERFRIAPLNP